MEENRGFTSFDTVSVLALVLGAIVLVTSIVGGALSDNKNIQARRHADEIAARLVVSGERFNEEIVGKAQEPDLARVPAGATPKSPGSVVTGQVSIDPWGSPYKYNIYKTADGLTYVSVISGGPNGIIETKPGQLSLGDNIRTTSAKQFERLSFAGDDIGVVQSRNEIQ